MPVAVKIQVETRCTSGLSRPRSSEVARAGTWFHQNLKRSWLAVLAFGLPGTSPVVAEVSAPRVTELEHMVIQDCGSCHGLTRKGGLGSPLTPEALVHAEAEGLAEIILDGVPGTAMPPWRPLLSGEEALWIAHYLKEVMP